MRRREFIAGLGGVAAWPLAAHAQQVALPVIGWLHSARDERLTGAVDSFPTAALDAFLTGLGEAGFTEGHNVVIEFRWAEFQLDRLPVLATDLIGRRVAVIVAGGVTPAALAAKAATATIPIVFVGADAPLESGLVASFSRPGGNSTGVIFDNKVLMAKRIELLHEVVPAAKSIALLVRPSDRGGTGFAEAESIAAQAAAAALGLQLHVLTATSESEIDAAFATLAQQRVEGLVLGTEVFFASRRVQIAALAMRYRIPTSHYRRDLVLAGGLMSYGANVPDGYRQAGGYAGRILKGEKPADLPVIAPAKFEMVLNVKTAKALGLEVPPSFYWRADEVIE